LNKVGVLPKYEISEDGKCLPKENEEVIYLPKKMWKLGADASYKNSTLVLKHLR
jgi:hypothetical protein